MKQITLEEYSILKEKESELKILSLNNAVKGFGRKFILDAQKIYARLYGINVCADCPCAVIEWLKQLYGELLKYERGQAATEQILVVPSVIAEPEIEPESPTFVAVTIQDTESENTKKVIYNEEPKESAKDNGKSTSSNRRNR